MSSGLWPLRLSMTFYGLVLRSYPLEFRERYGRETLLVFGDQCREVYRTGGVVRLLAVCLRAFPDVLRNAAAEHVADWLSDHPARHRSPSQQWLLSLGLVLAVIAVFLADRATPPEVPLAVMFACVLFAAGALLRPEIAALICAATLAVFVVDGMLSPTGWTFYRFLGLASIVIGSLWAMRTGADHARLRARSKSPPPRPGWPEAPAPPPRESRGMARSSPPRQA
jgi:hypothetical protein